MTTERGPETRELTADGLVTRQTSTTTYTSGLVAAKRGDGFIELRHAPRGQKDPPFNSMDHVAFLTPAEARHIAGVLLRLAGDDA